MVYNNKVLLGITLVIILNFNSCKKYEENPSFVILPKNSRLIGEWEIIRIDGESVETYFNNLYSGNTYNGALLNFIKINWIWDFEKDQDLDQDIQFIYSYTNTNYYGNTNSFTDTVSQKISMTWEWEDHKREIEIEQSNYYQTIRNDYEILKLTNSEMKLKDENDVEWEFEKL